MKERGEQSVCRFVGVEPDRPKAKSKLGIALSTIGKTPINGFRHPKSDGANGWYIWCGEEFSIEEGFFSPLHIEHVAEYLPRVLEYLELPTGYRFLIDENGYEDIWFDKELFNV